MSRLAPIVVVLLAFLSGSAVAQQEKLSLDLSAPSGSIRLGKPIKLNYRLHNLTDTALLVGDPTIVPQPTVPPDSWGIMLEVTTPAGTVYQLSREDLFAAHKPVVRGFFRAVPPRGKLEGVIQLANDPFENSQWAIYEAGRSWYGEEHTRLLDNLFDKAGTYKVRAVYSNEHQEVQGFEGDSMVFRTIPAWTGTIHSQVCSVKVVP